MSNLNVNLVVNTARKTCSQSGVPSVGETVNFVITGLAGTSAANLRLFITHKGELMASCESLSVGSGGYVARTSLSGLSLTSLFAGRKRRVEKTFRIVVQDIVQGIDFLNDLVTIMDNPYDAAAEAPETVDPIGA